MIKIHAKSPCCRGGIRKYGIRRRQCTLCKKTWRVRKKKRGRKHLRITPHLAERYLTKSTGTMHAYARIRSMPQETMRRRFIQSRTAMLARTPWEFPQLDEPLIAIADAMWHASEGIKCTTYFIVLRPVSSSRAWIMPPVTVPGTESWAGWRIAWEEVPVACTQRILALVCDGKQSLQVIGKQRGWKVQLCHFHLMALIKNYATGHAGTRWQERGRLILDTIQSSSLLKTMPCWRRIWSSLHGSLRPYLIDFSRAS